MKRIRTKKLCCCCMALAVLLTSVLGYSYNKKVKADGVADTAEARLLNKRNEVMAQVNMDTEGDKDEVVRAVIQLEDDAATEETGTVEYSEDVKEVEESVIEEQESIVDKVEKITGNKVENQTGYLVNSITIDASRNEIEKIAKLQGVEAVYESSEYTIQMDTAVESTNVKNQWEDEEYGYNGEGTVVAVIDTGVNYTHKDMVLDKDVKTKFTKDEWDEKIDLLGYGSYKSEKVPFAYNYVTGKNDCYNTEKVERGNEHGTHVAGIVAANGGVRGVAKDAQIIGLQLLDASQKNMNSSVDALVKAIEDAVKLGADVVNMSLGFEESTVNDIDFLQKAVNKASQMGVVCCISASNSGTSSSEMGENTNEMQRIDTSTIATPSVSEDSFSVASADNKEYVDMKNMNAKLGEKEVSFRCIDVTGKGFKLKNKDLVCVDEYFDEDGMLMLDEVDLEKKIAVTHTLDEYSLYEFKYADVDGIIYVCDDLTKEKFDYNSKIKTIAVEEDIYKLLHKAIDESRSYTTVKVQKETIKMEKPTTMSYFSSWGPSDELDIKPEITGIGGNVNSLGMKKDNYTLMSGTSMSSPFVAGCTAVLLNAIRDNGMNLENKELFDYLKNCIMNTANVVKDSTNNDMPYSVRYQGAGLVDLHSAVRNKVIATYNGKAKVELREINANTVDFTIDLKNYSKVDAKYKLADAKVYTDYTSEDGTIYNVKEINNAYIRFLESEVSVPAGGTAKVNARLVLPKGLEREKYIESYISLKGAGVEDLTLPVLGFYGDWNKETIVDSPVYDIEASDEDEDDFFEFFSNYETATGLRLSLDPTMNFAGTSYNNIGDFTDRIIKTVEVKGNGKKKVSTTIDDLPEGNYLVRISESDCTEYMINDDAWEDEGEIYREVITKAEVYTEEYYDDEDYEEIDDESEYGEDYEEELDDEESITGGFEVVLKSDKKTKKGEKVAKIEIIEGDNDLDPVYNKENIAISPNGDGMNDVIYPYISLLRNTKYMNVKVLDSNMKEVRVLGSNLVMNKLLNASGFDLIALLTGQSDSGRFISQNDGTIKTGAQSFVNWDGKLYDSAAGTYKTAKEGQYYIKIESKINRDDTYQSVVMPVKVDYKKPVVDTFQVNEVDGDTVVRFKVSDENGMSPNYYVDIEDNKHITSEYNSYNFKYATSKVDANGVYELNLGQVNKKDVNFMFEDNAGNYIIMNLDKANEGDSDFDNVNSDDLEDVSNDTVAPQLTIKDSKEFSEVIKETNGAYSIFMKGIVNNKCRVQFEVKDDNLNEDSFQIIIQEGEKEGISYTYKDGIYTVDFNNSSMVMGFKVVVSDMVGNKSELNCTLVKNFAFLVKFSNDYAKKTFGEFVKFDNYVIDNSMLNVDGTYTVSGYTALEDMQLYINDELVEQNANNEFKKNIAVKPGENKVYVELVNKKGKSYSIVMYVYLDNLTIDVDGLKNNDVINVKKDTFNVKANITSNIGISTVDINGNNIYTNRQFMVSRADDVLTKSINRVVKLEKGINNIELKVTNNAGKTYTKVIKVNNSK